MPHVTGRAVTAEWNCTRCNVTNRKLVTERDRSSTDTCMHCGLKHRVFKDERPVRWRAEAM
jgi:transcription elongation factor Elf1